MYGYIEVVSVAAINIIRAKELLEENVPGASIEKVINRPLTFGGKINMHGGRNFLNRIEFSEEGGDNEDDTKSSSFYFL